MKTTSISFVLAGLALAVACGGGAAQPAAPATAPSAVAKPPATAKGAAPADRRARAARIDALEAAVLRRLASPEAARLFGRYNAGNRRQLQQHLADIYGGDPAFVADAGGPGKPLGDSVVGPVTLRWLARFCRDHGIVASEPAFEQDVMDSLEQVAAIARAHPDWLKILSSAEFDAWIAGQSNAQRMRFLQIRRSGAAAQVNALIEQFLLSRRPPRAAPPVRHRQLDVTYAYDPARPAGIENLGAIAARLKPLAARDAADEQWFVEDVRDALDGIPLTDETLNLIRRYSEVDVYMVRPELLVKLRKEGMAEPLVMAIHDQMGGVEFDTLQGFADALAVVAEASEDPAAITEKQRHIVRAARFVRYKVPATLGDDLAAEVPLEKPLADLFAGIANVPYPTKELFDRALEFQVRRALDMCPEADRERALALADARFDALAALPLGLGGMFERVRALRAVRTGCAPEQLVEADQLAFQAYQALAPRFDRKMDLETLNVVMPEKAREGNWAIPYCRCGRPGSQGMVYGFLPLWTRAGERQVDFGALTRVGLYGLTADEHGALQGPRGLQAAAAQQRIAGLLRAAHLHRVGVDWVVGRTDWTGWEQSTAAQKQAFFARLAASIRRQLEQEPPDGGQGMIRMASLGTDRGPTGGDGVVLYFRSFPAADKGLFNDFVVQLSAQLKHLSPARRVTLMADFAAIGQPGLFDHRNLLDLVERTNPIREDVAFAMSKNIRGNDMPILVLLTEPTQRTKETLRGGLREALHGTDSLRLMRALLPIVEFDGSSSQQLADDIVFSSQNFHGIGFWPLPFAAAADDAGDTSVVNRLVTKYYQPNRDPPTAWDRAMGYLCPHRLWLRWVAWIALLAAAIVAVAYLRCRGCNARLDSSPLYFSATVGVLALPLLALFLLVLSDPVLEPFAPAMLFMYGTGGIVAAGLVARYYFNKSLKKVP